MKIAHVAQCENYVLLLALHPLGLPDRELIDYNEMPNMLDERFYKAVIYVCAHSKEGSMGIIINKETNLPAKTESSPSSTGSISGDGKSNPILHSLDNNCRWIKEEGDFTNQ